MKFNKLQSVVLSKKIYAFALVEVLIAISLLLITVITVSSMTISMIRTNSMNHNHLIATELAREGLELTRNIRDTNWNYYRYWLKDIYNGTNNNPYIFGIDIDLQPDNSTFNLAKVYNYGGYVEYKLSSKESQFKRIVTVTPKRINTVNGSLLDKSVGGDYIFSVIVESRVEWSDRDINRSVVFSTELTDWQK